MRQGKQLQSRIEALEEISAPKGYRRFVLVPRDADETEREAILAAARAQGPNDSLQIITCERADLLL